MKVNLFYTVFGYRRLYANSQNCLALLNLCMERGFSYSDFRSEEDGGVSFICSNWTAKQIQKLCVSRGICIAESTVGGLPHFLWRYRRRMGMIIGLSVGTFLLWLSGQFVWDVRIEGNETLTATEIRQCLKDCGFGVGSYIRNFNGNELENRVLIASDQISWISVYMDGTVAVVQIKENELPPAATSTRPANLVAAYDGQIELLELYRGDSVVKIGSAVRKGDLLVSGVYDSNTVGYRYTRAAGRVLARVEEEIRIEIPLCYEKKVYLENKMGKISLDFFDFSIKILKNSGNYDAPCDIIKDRKTIDLLGLSRLPIGWTKETVCPYRMETATRSEEEARALAEAELEMALARLAEEAELLDRIVTVTVTESACVIECRVSCIRDIAVQVEFDVIEEE